MEMKEMIEKINNEASKHISSFKASGIWESYGHKRLYLNRNGCKTGAGYIDLIKKEGHFNTNHISNEGINNINKILKEA